MSFTDLQKFYPKNYIVVNNCVMFEHYKLSSERNVLFHAVGSHTNVNKRK